MKIIDYLKKMTRAAATLPPRYKVHIADGLYVSSALTHPADCCGVLVHGHTLSLHDDVRHKDTRRIFKCLKRDFRKVLPRLQKQNIRIEFRGGFLTLTQEKKLCREIALAYVNDGKLCYDSVLQQID